MGQRSYKRRQLIVDPDFQYRFIGRISILALLIILMALFFLAAVYYSYGDIQVGVIQPSPFESFESAKIERETHTILDLIWPLLGVCILITLAIVFFFALVTSHRMAGPIFRLRKVLEEMAGGNLSGQVRLREKDSFKNLAEEVNNLGKSWRVSIKEMREISDHFDRGDPGERQQHLNRLKEILAAFRTE